MNKIISFYIVIFIFLNFSQSLFAETFIVEGDIEYVFEVYSKNKKLLDQFYEYENESNSQKIIKKEPGKITVKTYTKLDFFNSKVPFPVDNTYHSDPKLKEKLALELTENWYIIKKKNGKTIKEFYTKRLPLTKDKIGFLKSIVDRETQGVKTQQEAVERLMAFLRQNVTYQLGVSSDPVDVIKSGRAFCEGYANAALLLTRILGIPSRKRSCYIPPGHMWGFAGPNNKGAGGFHAYIEVYYKDKGWVSYDPQATVHFVDPYHIVNFPRNGVRLKEVSLKDSQKIVDAVSYPEKWPHFYKRRTEKKQHNAVIIGKIINRNKQLVKDSEGTKDWVFIRNDDGSGRGVKILESGYFAIPVFDLEKPVNFFFNDKYGGYLEKYVLLNKKSPVEMNFDLSNKNETIIVKLPDKKRILYVWNAGKDGKPKLYDLKTAGDGSIALSLSDGNYLFSYSKNTYDPNYKLSVDDSLLGKTINLVDIPLYFNPSGYFVYGKVNSKDYPIKKLEYKVTNTSGTYYEVGKDVKGQFSIGLPGNEKYQFSVNGHGIIAIKSVDLSKNKNLRLDINLNSKKYLTLKLNKKAPLIFWQKNKKGEWGLSIVKNRAEKIKIIADTGPLILSQTVKERPNLITKKRPN